MKHVLFLAMVALFTFTANAQTKDSKQVKDSKQSKDTKQVMTNKPEELYKVESNNISIGNMAYAQKVLRAWKDYDNNTLANSADIFADNVEVSLPDGTVLKGKENVLKGIGDYRGTFTSVTSTVHACTALKTPDHPDMEIVTIWGLETDTNKDGSTLKTHLNEVWFFNKDGKVTQLHQLAAKENQ